MITQVNDPRMTPEQIWKAQSKILKLIYTPEYPSSVCDTESAIVQTQKWVQNVLFWWENLNKIQSWNGGTIALVDSDIPQCLEMCRAWATVETGESIQAIQKLIHFFQESKKQHSTLYVTTRNCIPRTSSSGTEIKWWQTIYTIFNRLKDFQFFWFAPWYIMPGWTVEALDIRVHQRNMDTWKTSFQNWSPLYVVSSEVWAILHEMLDEYIADKVKIHVLEKIWGAINDLTCGTFTTDYSELWMRNSLFFIPGDGNNSLEEMDNDPTPIKTLRVNLNDQATLWTQAKAELLWYRFTGIIPTDGKCFWFWTKIDWNFPIAKPCYLYENNKRLPQYQRKLYESLYWK